MWQVEAARMEYCTYSHNLKQTSVKAWFLSGNKVLLLMPLTQSKDTIDHTFFFIATWKYEALGASDWTGSFINPQDTCWCCGHPDAWEWTADWLWGTPERAPSMASLSLLHKHLHFIAALCPSQIVGMWHGFAPQMNSGQVLGSGVFKTLPGVAHT